MESEEVYEPRRRLLPCMTQDQPGFRRQHLPYSKKISRALKDTLALHHPTRVLKTEVYATTRGDSCL